MKKAKKLGPRTPTAVDAYIVARMRDARLALGLTQEDLSRRLGISFQLRKRIEPRERCPLIRDLRSFGRISGVDVRAQAERVSPRAPCCLIVAGRFAPPPGFRENRAKPTRLDGD